MWKMLEVRRVESGTYLNVHFIIWLVVYELGLAARQRRPTCLHFTHTKRLPPFYFLFFFFFHLFFHSTGISRHTFMCCVLLYNKWHRIISWSYPHYSTLCFKLYNVKSMCVRVSEWVSELMSKMLRIVWHSTCIYVFRVCRISVCGDVPSARVEGKTFKLKLAEARNGNRYDSI